MDSITHALLVASLLTAIGAPELIPFGILGAVIPDADLIFHLVSSKRPPLYIFTHGGAAHSIAGAAGMAVIAYGTVYLLVLAGVSFFWDFTLPFTVTLAGITVVIAGALLHIVLDFLASPGIPLLWPWKETKYTCGVFAGPSAVMIAISLAFLILFIAGIIRIPGLIVYGVLFLVYLAISITIRIAAMKRMNGMTFPTINPLIWLAIEKYKDLWSLKLVNLMTGYESGNRTWPALSGVTQEDIGLISDIPAVRRVRYHSCFTIASRMDNGDIVIHDPVREEGIVRYPPYYTSVTLKQKGGAGWEVVNE